jgi:DNA-binding transcriptional regulator YhcF (GntR family)
VILTLDLTVDVPIYQQIRDRVVEAIAVGALVAGSPLPSTRQLAVDLGVNFHTVNKSYDELRHEGLLRINRKSGAVVHRDPGSGPPAAGVVDAWRGRLFTLLAEVVAHGVDRATVLDHCRNTLSQFTAPSENPDPQAPASKSATVGNEAEESGE